MRIKVLFLKRDGLYGPIINNFLITKFQVTKSVIITELLLSKK